MILILINLLRERFEGGVRMLGGGELERGPGWERKVTSLT